MEIPDINMDALLDELEHSIQAQVVSEIDEKSVRCETPLDFSKNAHEIVNSCSSYIPSTSKDDDKSQKSECFADVSSHFIHSENKNFSSNDSPSIPAEFSNELSSPKIFQSSFNECESFDGPFFNQTLQFLPSSSCDSDTLAIVSDVVKALICAVSNQLQEDDNQNEKKFDQVNHISPQTELRFKQTEKLVKIRPDRSVIESTHYLSIISSEFKLTESELLLGKNKPFWIPDEDCLSCMLCSIRFTLVNRRHHCRACGRVLCKNCCSYRRMLSYSNEKEGKQRICEPCNKTLDRIDEYKKRVESMSSQVSAECQSQASSTSGLTSKHELDKESFLSQYDNRKKSLLKAARKDSITLSDDTIPTTSSNISIPDNSQQLDNSSLKNLAMQKRSVTFRDGIKPGDDIEGIDQANNPDSTINTLRLKKNKRISQRTREKRAEEEYLSFVHTNTFNRAPSSSNDEFHKQMLMNDFLFIINEQGEFFKQPITEIISRLRDGAQISLAIRRNLSVTLLLSEDKISLNTSSEIYVLFASSSGFVAIGADELVLLLELDKDMSSSEEMLLEHISEVLVQYDDMFSRCLDPALIQGNANFDLEERMGIRKCTNRMARVFPTHTNSLVGISATVIYFHRPRGQNFGTLPIPSSPFLVGTLIKPEELIWIRSNVQNRILFNLGLKYSCYPTPLINFRKRDPSLILELPSKTVLKIFNDFYSWQYRMQFLPSTYASMSENKIELFIPVWIKDELKAIVESNRNVIGWALDFNSKVDSHLVCDESSNGHFETRIFTKPGGKRNVTGGTFIIFDGALKQNDRKFTVAIVEDGFMIRLHSECMEELVKALLNGEDFDLNSSLSSEEQSQDLSIKFFWDHYSQSVVEGSLVSPIDGINLEGNFQYGLVLSRQFRSLNFFKNSSEWALRLSSVVNISPGKFPSALQPKYFELSEQIAVLLTTTIEPFLQELVFASQRSITIRICIEDDMATYEAEKWQNLRDQHLLWTALLDEQIVPFLYSICQWLTNGFHVELNMHIVSIRPIPTLTTTSN